jgi:hypothetical protein
MSDTDIIPDGMKFVKPQDDESGLYRDYEVWLEELALHPSVSLTAQLETQDGAKVRVGSWLSPGQSVGRHISLPSAHRQALRLFL